MSILLHLSSFNDSPNSFLDGDSTFISQLLPLLDFKQKSPGIGLNKTNFTDSHGIISVSYHLKVQFLGQHFPQVLLHHHRILFLQPPFSFEFCKEHSYKTLDINHYQLKFHIHQGFSTLIASPDPLNKFGSNQLNS